MKLVVQPGAATARGAQRISFVSAEGIEATFTLNGSDRRPDDPIAEVTWTRPTAAATRIDGGPVDAAIELAALLCQYADRSLVVHPSAGVGHTDVFPPGGHPRIDVSPDDR